MDFVTYYVIESYSKSITAFCYYIGNFQVWDPDKLLGFRFRSAFEAFEVSKRFTYACEVIPVQVSIIDVVMGE